MTFTILASIFLFVAFAIGFVMLAFLMFGNDLHLDTSKSKSRQRQLKKAAKRSLAENEKIWSEKPHEYRIVEDVRSDFPDIDHTWVGETQAHFERLGCHFVADIENITLCAIHPQMRTYIRTMLSPDGTIKVGIYHFKMRGMMGWMVRIFGMPTTQHVIDLESEFSDGTDLVITTARKSSMLHDPPHMTRCYAPVEATPGQLLQWAQSWVEYIRETRGVEPTIMRNYEEMIAADHRQHARNAAYRRSVGYFTSEDAQQIAPNETFARDGEQLSRLIAELNESKKAASGDKQEDQPPRQD